MEYTVDEFKSLVAKMTQLEQNQRNLILKLDDSVNENGVIKTGILGRLEELTQKLDPQSLEFINGNARAEAEKANEKIKELLVAQDQYFNDRIFDLDAVLQNGSKELKNQIDTIQTRTREAINDDIGKVADGLSLRINKDTSNVLNRFDKFKEELDAFKANAINNYLWQIIAMTLGLGIGTLVGLYL